MFLMRKLLSGILIMLLVICFAPAAALAEDQAQEEQMELSLEDAVKRALGFSNAVEKAWLDIDKADDSRIPLAEGYYSTPGFESVILAGESASFDYDKANKNLGLTRDQVTLNTYDKYFDSLRKQKELEIKELALGYSGKELEAAKALHSVGMLNRIGLDGMETKVLAAQNEYNAAGAELENAFVSFNQMLGFKEDTRPLLITVPEFAPWEKDLQMHISTVLHESPMLWTASEAADFMESIANIGAIDSITEEDAKKAKLDATDARDATRLMVRSLHSAVKKMEDGYAAAEQGVKMAQETLRITELKNELGMATKTEVLEAQLALASAEQGLFDLVCQHEFMKKVLETPWAYSGN